MQEIFQLFENNNKVQSGLSDFRKRQGSPRRLPFGFSDCKAVSDLHLFDRETILNLNAFGKFNVVCNSSSESLLSTVANAVKKSRCKDQKGNIRSQNKFGISLRSTESLRRVLCFRCNSKGKSGMENVIGRYIQEIFNLQRTKRRETLDSQILGSARGVPATCYLLFFSPQGAASSQARIEGELL